MLQRIRLAIVAAAIGPTLLAQSDTFEAASVKTANPSNPPGQGISRAPGGRFTAVNAPLRFLILYAYQLQNYQVAGAPDWIANERFDIVAKMEGDPPSIVTSGVDPMRLAMRALLADRFGFVAHTETRELDIYALTMARPDGKPGAALKPSPEDCAAMAARANAAGPVRVHADSEPPFLCGQSMGQGRIRFAGYPLSLFANGLSNQVGRAVVDRTGLTGNWAFELKFAPLTPGADPIDPDTPNLFTAVQEQLGLKLDSTTGPVDVLVIDRVQRPMPD